MIGLITVITYTIVFPVIGLLSSILILSGLMLFVLAIAISVKGMIIAVTAFCSVPYGIGIGLLGMLVNIAVWSAINDLNRINGVD